MRPTRLRLEGFRSFGTDPPTEIAFDHRNQIAIIGDTGAGKSSILEAITYALYGQTSVAAQNQEILNDRSRHLRVTLDFWARNNQWRVTRMLKRRRTGDAGAANCVLERFHDTEQPVETWEGVKETNRRICDLIGLDAGAFLRTIVLPQGRFARLLSEDDPRQRARILQQIWETADLERAAAAVTDALRRAGETATHITAELDYQSDDVDGHLKALATAADNAEREAAAARSRESAAEAALTTVQTAADTVERCAAARRTLTTVTDRTEALEALGTDESRLADSAAAADETAAKAAAALRNAPAADPHRLAATERAGRLLDDLQRSIDDHAERRTAHERLRAAADEARRAHDEAAAAAASRRQAWEKHERQERRLATEADRTAALAAEMSVQLQLHDSRYTQPLREARRRLAETDQRTGRLVDLAGEAWFAQDAMRASEEQAGAALAAARRQNAAADAAAACSPGDLCPVCERPLPEAWSPRPAEGLDRAESEHAAAARAARAADAEADRRTRDITACEREHADLEATIERLQEAAAGDRERLATLLGLEAADELPPSEAAAAAPQAAADAARTALERHRAAGERLRAAHHEQQERAAVGGETRKRLDEQATDAATAAAASAQRLAAATDTWKEHEQASGDAPATGHDADALRRARERINATVTAERAAILHRNELATAADKAREAADAARRCRERFRSTEGAAAAAALAGDRDRIREAAAALRADDRLPAAPPAADAAMLLDHAAATEAARERLLEAADAAGRDAARARADGTAKLTALDDDGAPPDAAPHERAERVRNARRDAERSAATAADRAQRFRTAAPILRALQAEKRASDTRVNRLTELENTLKAGAFPKWLTLRRSVQLLRHASRRLEQMTRGRYAFLDPRDTGEQWRVTDTATGGVRSPASLSGGEQFLASLALALGMIETMGQRGGRLECFFLDEGFGSLDRNTLDTALAALEDAATDDHMIGVISHVRNIAEQCDHVLAVTRTPGRGSSARWLNDDERLALTDDDSYALTATR